MNIDQPKDQPVIEYKGRVQRLKMDIQKQVIAHFCHGDINNQEKVDTWIQEFSNDFHQIYDRRVRTEEGFLDRAQEHLDQVVEEIITELEKSHSVSH